MLGLWLEKVSLGFPTRLDGHRPAQLKKLGGDLK